MAYERWHETRTYYHWLGVPREARNVADDVLARLEEVRALHHDLEPDLPVALCLLFGRGVLTNDDKTIVVPRIIARLHAEWLHAARTQLLQVLGYSVLTTTVQWFVNRSAGTRVTAQIGRVFLAVVGLICWLCATMATGPWSVLLRLPLVWWCGRWVVNRTFRFLPKRAGPDPMAGTSPAM